MFYSNPNDRMQMLAAEELFQRNWKFHKEEKIWISRTRNIEVNTLLDPNQTQWRLLLIRHSLNRHLTLNNMMTLNNNVYLGSREKFKL